MKYHIGSPPRVESSHQFAIYAMCGALVPIQEFCDKLHGTQDKLSYLRYFMVLEHIALKRKSNAEGKHTKK